jgi:hypothetical protein
VNNTNVLRFDSIHLHPEFESNDPDESDFHMKKHSEQRTSISRGIVTEARNKGASSIREKGHLENTRNKSLCEWEHNLLSHSRQQFARRNSESYASHQSQKFDGIKGM